MRALELRRLAADYGMTLVLLLLCAVFSALTFSEQHPTGAAAGIQVADKILSLDLPARRILIVARSTREDRQFAATAAERLRAASDVSVDIVAGQPRDVRRALERFADADEQLDAIACTSATASWLAEITASFPSLQAQLIVPRSYRWPDFLKSSNLLNITNQIAVIAIVAVGMTLVIVTGGIDLSVGSLIGLSAVLACLFIREYGGATSASVLAMLASGIAACLLCGLVGLATGLLITALRVPPFIVTLSMMLVASGAAFRLTGGESVHQVPDSFVWLGRGSAIGSLPNAAVLMLLIYGAAHVLTTRTALGRYLYAVGGNVQAARLSGVPVRRVLLFAYVASGVLAGLGGVVMASQLKSGAPAYGQMYELYTIAAVVVGGTSLAGGQGKVFGTLVGAFIIAVIQNGMNLMNVESYTQNIVLGAVILLAVAVDKLKREASFSAV